MTKQEKETKEAPAVPAAPAMQMMVIRRGRYVGGRSRVYDSVPWGERLTVRQGVEYQVRDSFAHIWQDPRTNQDWEWLGEPEQVPAVNEGQTPRP